MSSAPATILVARHADAEYETHHWADEGGSLSTRGRAEAASLGKRLEPRKISHVWSSTYARAVQTAEVAAARLGVPVTTREGLQDSRSARWRAHGPATRSPTPTARGWPVTWNCAYPEGRAAPSSGSGCTTCSTRSPSGTVGRPRSPSATGGVMRLTLPLILTREPADPPARPANCAVVEITVDDHHWTAVRWPPEDA